MDEALQKAKMCHFPFLDLGGRDLGGGKGGYKFPIYFVQDCSSELVKK